MTACSSPLLLAYGKPQKLLIWSATNALILPLCFYFFGKYFALEGVYAAWLLVYPVSGVFFLLRIVRSALKIEPAEFLLNLRTPLVSSLIMALSVALFQTTLGASLSPFLSLALKAAVGTAVYLAVLKYIFNAEDITDAIRLIKSLRTRNPE